MFSRAVEKLVYGIPRLKVFCGFLILNKYCLAVLRYVMLRYRGYVVLG